MSLAYFSTKQGATQQRWLVVVSLLAIMCFGLWLRFDDLQEWQENPQNAFYNGEPTLVTFDGYYYLSLARDLSRDTYQPVDAKRGVPDSPGRPFPPPLLSVLLSTASQLTHLPLNWVGALLPAFLGILLALPLYGFGRSLDGRLMGLSAAVLGLGSIYYVARSSIGWLDTDCMNITWTMSVAYCFFRFGQGKDYRRYYFLLGGIFISLLFLWWWDQASAVVVTICGLPLVVALLLFYRPGKREAMIFYALLLFGLFLFFFWKGPDVLVTVGRSILEKLQYIAKEDAGIFPNIGVSISEQRAVSLQTLVDNTTGSGLLFVLAVGGLLFLFWKKPKESLFLLAPFSLSFFAFFYAERFLIFLSPILALGAAFFISRLWAVTAVKVLRYAALLFLFLFVNGSADKALSRTIWPLVPPQIVAGMALAAQQTPADAVLWSWWDHGYHLLYWADRATVDDGSVHGGERTFWTALPLVQSDQRLAANLMQFYVSRGLRGIKKVYALFDNNQARGIEFIKEIMAAGPEGARGLLDKYQFSLPGQFQSTDDWLRFFFPAASRPLYLFLDHRMMRASWWWYWFANWDFEKKESRHPFYNIYLNVSISAEMVRGLGGIQVNLKTGHLQQGNEGVDLLSVHINDGENVISHSYDNGTKGFFHVNVPGKFAVLQNHDMVDTLGNRLYVLAENDQVYFRPVILRSPIFQLWEVRGDTFVPTPPSPLPQTAP
ncbi:STT3 domain-containing protein [Thiovibrio sp. JS02]